MMNKQSNRAVALLGGAVATLLVVVAVMAAWALPQTASPARAQTPPTNAGS